MGRKRIHAGSGKKFVGAEVDLQTHREFRDKLLAEDYTATYVLPKLIQCYINGEIIIRENEPKTHLPANHQPSDTWAERD